MSKQQKLDSGEKHFMRLIDRDKKDDGWTPVSRALYPLVAAMPRELIELEKLDNGTGRVRLTPEGQSILDAMAWL